MKTIKTFLGKNKSHGIAEELTKSYAKVNENSNDQNNFKTWFANIIYHSHPINKQMFE